MSLLNRIPRTLASERLLLIEAAFFMTLARLAVSFVPFRRLAPYLGQHMKESPEETSELHRIRAHRIARSIQRVNPLLPWTCTCLGQALAAMVMLRRCGHGSTLYLGVTRGIDSQIDAHAWLRSGDVIVTGAQQQPRYTVMSSFMHPRG